MEADSFVPVAQYLRMSTEHQRYSMENQASAIYDYARSRGFEVVRTYSDAAKSGLALKRRIGLKQLLQDVMSGSSEFKAILVYDVSRWGRFQDIDESAHYEFLCKSAGVPVHYCAESFINNTEFANMMIKVLKRSMAGEFSREIGIKVLAGQKRLARQGFKQGGIAGYGLRRMLVTPDREPKQELSLGQRKSIATDRVVLVPGPANEVQVVREIYRMLIEEKLSVYAIARTLNDRGVQYQGNLKWNHGAVSTILTHPKYEGVHVFARTSSRLSSPCVSLPKTEWVVTPGAFEQIVDRETFANAQAVLQSRTVNKSNEDILESLRALLEPEGRLSFKLIKESAHTPSPSVFRTRFGSLRRAYELIGYVGNRPFNFIDLRRRTQAIREQLIMEIAARFPEDVAILRRGGRWRTRLRVRNCLTVSVVASRSVRVWKNTVRWAVEPLKNESQYVTLLAQLDEGNRSFHALHVLPGINRTKRFYLRQNDIWLKRGIRLNDLSQFCAVATAVASTAIVSPA